MIGKRLRALMVLAATAASFALVPTGTAVAGQEDCLPANVQEFMRDYRSWGAAPTVQAYMALFTPDATLMDSGLAEPIGLPKIRAQIEAVLRVVPDYRFDPHTVTAAPDGKVVFIQASNTGTVNRQKITFTTLHRLELVGSDVRQGRRFWDQTELFRPVAPELPRLFDGVAAPVTPAALMLDPASGSSVGRQQAWNSQQPAALVAGLGQRVRLTGTGLAEPLTGRPAATAYLNRLFGAIEALDLAPGHRVRQGGTEYLEWVGTATVGGAQPRTVTFGIVERLVRRPGAATQWSLHFDTLDLVATADQITALRKLIFG